jgi:hypothetical protein
MVPPVPAHVKTAMARPIPQAQRSTINASTCADDLSAPALSGAVLHWKNGTFTPVRDEKGTPTVAGAFTAVTPTEERQLILTLRTRHPADENLVLGNALETAFQHLTGAPPAGWSTAEPVGLPWSARQLTEFARTRAPQPTWLTAVGHPDLAALVAIRVLRTPAGVEEDITLALGYGRDEEPPLDAIEPLAAALAAEDSLVSLLTSLRAARRDLTIPPSLEPLPIPMAFTLGHNEIENVDLAHAERPPAGPTPTRLGHAAHPTLHYPLGDGTDPEAWSTFQQLTRHLKQA